MYRDIDEGRDVKITEKSEKARMEFFDKCEKHKKGSAYNDKLMQDIANKCAAEYLNVFGRIGLNPLLHVKDGKKRPRYLVDRAETWVIYKPALWQMGGNSASWRHNVWDAQRKTKSLKEAEEKYLASSKNESLQEWHLLHTGLVWIPPEKAGEMKDWGFIQRLDVETDGPVIIAKTWRNQRALQVQMKLHVNHKAYMCLVHGRLDNKTQHIRRKFATLGTDGTEVMLQHDAVNDPFFDWSMQGKWPNRNVRMAETFLTPLAYYHREEDNTDYTLVYVNILTGITHQIRITMQSLGHPLVSDDRYLPKDQATADLKWCPRNFLCEVRSDFFDVAGPHKDPARRRYTRISIENPLPQMFQNVLTRKLVLKERLDPTADLFVGPQYWAIGDKELMTAHPKDDEYRKKVMRWGIRKGIHLDALNRLLLLSCDDIDDVLNNYRPPSELGEKKDSNWICPVCMHWNTFEEAERAKWDKKGWRKNVDTDVCRGGGKITALGRACWGRRVADDDTELPNGWMNYVKDPTIHFLFLVNAKWLDARRAVFKSQRPSWERPPEEADAMIATPAMLVALEQALTKEATSTGELGIQECDLVKVAGLEDVQLPLGLPEKSDVQRCRLPGCGSQSQWVYTLKAHKRVEITSKFDARTKRLEGPLYVKTDKLPDKQLKRKSSDRNDDSLGLQPEADDSKTVAKGWDWDADDAEEPPAKKTRRWECRQSTTNPEKSYWVDMVTGETKIERPEDVNEKDCWEKMISKSSGKAYYHNHATGENRIEKPEGVEIKNAIGEAAKPITGTSAAAASSPPKAARREVQEEVRWERRESKSQPGSFYYFNHNTGENEITPPRVEFPWQLLESKSKRGQFYYYNEVTAESTVDPPGSAKAKKAEAGTGDAKATATSPPAKAAGAAAGRKQEKLPRGWAKKESEKYKGKFYYLNEKTGETSWSPPSPWERAESTSNPGRFYYINCETGETSWDKQVVGVKK